MITEKDMLDIKDNEKKKMKDTIVSEELDNNIPKMIEKVKEEMKLKENISKTDDFLTKDELSNYIEEKRKEQSKVLKLNPTKEELNKAS